MQSQTPLEPLSATSLGAETECEVLSDDPYAVYIPQQLNYSGLSSRTSNEVCGSYNFGDPGVYLDQADG
ncbi:hypothetical protein EJ05DRAFT_481307 [Pseudovirgaria hyperparasitica]|uniref:Uncharacterized protein n=1 Tax=Pseudovirgaria hyperparasitica TaxID=470096 RepID=A0A6A6VP20_9PEZI|nr:uncharacterized protein EJ05DRAFT_481331 [Pseudovirgaria hyperparasitica]XP_033594880.1 uncharacterized protein EJ05DRAFT_481307 [Pseudovirgaria hyperparasitica]KAF2752378.1 hypothetical protein EJ05DRAFT_481331 [Pseudovirgaria hyperparasitica]KAF2752422.1 hypothetical protein EJ05DRAFT_481307 [Pseudovirgaria hyperparasitica]